MKLTITTIIITAHLLAPPPAPRGPSTPQLVATMPKLSALTQAVIQVESEGDPLALSHKDARGLMQIRPIALDEYNRVTGEGIRLAELWNPAVNIHVGEWMLYERLMPMCGGDLDCALNAYNVGWGEARRGVTNWGYVDKVLYAMRIY